VLANTTSGFALGDREWILAFESNELADLVLHPLRRNAGGSPLQEERHAAHH
jgi:chlorite dismutase